MTSEEKAKYLNNLLLILQKFRSNLELDYIQNEILKRKVASDLLPWIMSDKCPIPALIKSLEIYEKTGDVDNLFFYNMMVIVNNLQPELVEVAILLGYPKFPEPSLDLFVGG